MSPPRYAPTYTGHLQLIPGHADPGEWPEFARQVLIVPGGCHLWMGKLFPAGYGRFTTVRPAPGGLRQRVIIGAHRYSYLAHYGPVPAPPPPPDPGQLTLELGVGDPGEVPARPRDVIRHRCDIAAALEGRHAQPEMLCVNPAHLAPGDAGYNADDREHSGRGGRRRHGVRRPGTDGRPRPIQSALKQQAAREALLGEGLHAVAAAIAAVNADGDPYRDQLAVLPPPLPVTRLRLIR